MSERKCSGTRGTLTSTPAGMLSLDATVALRQRQEQRPPAAAGSNWRCPLILLAEERQSVRVALKTVLETSGYDVIVVERASETLSIAARYGGQIHFLVTNIVFHGMNGGLLAHLFRRAHPETRALFLCSSPEEVLICADTLDQKVTVLEQPVRLDVFARKVGEMIETRQGIQ